MIYQCRACDFKTFNESEYMQHVKAHTPVKPTEPAEQPTQPAKERDRNSSPRFLPKFLGKDVICTSMTGQQFHGTLTGFNEYELVLDVQGKPILLWKHALLSMKITGANV